MLLQVSVLLKTFSVSVQISATPSTTSTASPLIQLMNSQPSFNAQCHPLLSLPLPTEQSWARSSEPPGLCPVFFSVPINTLYRLYLLMCLSPSWPAGNLRARADWSFQHNGWHEKGTQEIFSKCIHSITIYWALPLFQTLYYQQCPEWHPCPQMLQPSRWMDVTWVCRRICT